METSLIWKRLPAVVAILALAAAPFAASAQTDDAGVRLLVERSGNEAYLVVEFPRPVARNADQLPMLSAFTGGGRTWWESPLTQAGNRWRTTLDRRAIEGLLIAQRVAVVLPAATAGSEPVTITIPREEVMKQLANAGGLFGQEAPFLALPEQPAPAPAAPGPDADRAQMERYALDVARWYREMQVYVPRFTSQVMLAQSLWRDLRTAGRIPWSESVAQAQEEKYAKLQGQQTEFERRREQVLAEARRRINEWNERNSGQVAVALPV